jgi:hypothetical protein
MPFRILPDFKPGEEEKEEEEAAGGCWWRTEILGECCCTTTTTKKKQQIEVVGISEVLWECQLFWGQDLHNTAK